ncbi:MAG: UbiA family prenyltransferase [Planctomycetota bacterium]
MGGKWWTYQRERFPVVGHGVLIGAFSFSAVAFSGMLRGEHGMPAWPAIVVAFVSCFLFFLQLRIADEFKDFEEDARYRPYRPVPRGLVSLRELGVVFVMAGVVQLALAWWLDARLIVLLGVTWVYLALMSKEFFVRRWLNGRPVVYLLSHMAIMPLIDLYATSTDWLIEVGRPPSGLVWFLLASFFNGIVIEIGRKIRSPSDEEEGVKTYSVVWGPRAAVTAWGAAIVCTWGCAVVAAWHIGFVWPTVAVFGVTGGVAVVLVSGFLRAQAQGMGKRVEHLSGVWTLALYLVLGVAPLVTRGFGNG